MSQQRIVELEKKVAHLEEQLERMRQMLVKQGVDEWVSLPKAAIALGISRIRLLDEIHQAQNQPRKSDLKYGVHYRNKGRASALTPTWQINLAEFSNYLAIPTEKRKGA